MAISVRQFQIGDYPQLVTLYKTSSFYGGQFDEDRDSEVRLRRRIAADPDAILVADRDGTIVGTVSLIEDDRTAWLFRFAIAHIQEESEIAQKLYSRAVDVLAKKGHSQVLIYSPSGDEHLDKRYELLGFRKGNDYTCYWKKI